ncbi:spermidine/putrescine ABC transporter ATP-binding protein [Hahella sp. CCB-MM4]|uniref:ABC transporter ATP-binding protein n=1 Tax=Hahella sp. (strain CCB-MM4) TaxID=1926491 RepID=UPI000B9AC435|nr:ABC transporter ATP-binding protein [Hahella sp. CCB-MM4]OZG72824.1 spermidine/putrescine ABC transporter ATP-binding protein [Hahella sp. CCB-MM4]
MSTLDNSYVRFQNVRKTYDGEILVVKDFNLDIAQGEFVTMLGPSGSGKTTCLMMLAGFESATQGEIYIDGTPVNNLAPHKRDIGMVFQNYALFPHLTIAENLSFPLKVRKLSKSDIEQKVKRALDMIELPQVAGRRPGQLSGGQQQRVALARALVFEPKLVLMDEPLGALDKQLREQMQYEIKHLHERLGITVLYVTHDQTEALTMSDRIAVFNQGVVQQLASPTELYEQPANSFVAQFIGENNKLSGKVEKIGNDRCVVSVEGCNVQALPVNVYQSGEATTLSIRPERIQINPENDFDNRFDARVLELIYHGDHMRTRVELMNHDQFIVKVPNGSRPLEIRKGDLVQVGWLSRDCRALDASSGQA